MKTAKLIAKIAVGLAAVAGAVYIIATYGEKIVAWCKNLLASLPCCCNCPCTCDCESECTCEEGECICECKCANEAADEVEVEVVAEEPAAEEVPAEEVPAEVEVPAAEEADFAN